MRTATTIGKRHDGTWEVISSPETPIAEQITAKQKLSGVKVHREFAQIRFQESDGAAQWFPAERFTFAKPVETSAPSAFKPNRTARVAA